MNGPRDAVRRLSVPALLNQTLLGTLLLSLAFPAIFADFSTPLRAAELEPTQTEAPRAKATPEPAASEAATSEDRPAKATSSKGTPSKGTAAQDGSSSGSATGSGRDAGAAHENAPRRKRPTRWWRPLLGQKWSYSWFLDDAGVGQTNFTVREIPVPSTDTTPARFDLEIESDWVFSNSGTDHSSQVLTRVVAESLAPISYSQILQTRKEGQTLPNRDTAVTVTEGVADTTIRMGPKTNRKSAVIPTGTSLFGNQVFEHVAVLLTWNIAQIELAAKAAEKNDGAETSKPKEDAPRALQLFQPLAGVTLDGSLTRVGKDTRKGVVLTRWKFEFSGTEATVWIRPDGTLEEYRQSSPTLELSIRRDPPKKPAASSQPASKPK